MNKINGKIRDLRPGDYFEPVSARAQATYQTMPVSEYGPVIATRPDGRLDTTVQMETGTRSWGNDTPVTIWRYQ